jgi:hypothetical protein
MRKGKKLQLLVKELAEIEENLEDLKKLESQRTLELEALPAFDTLEEIESNLPETLNVVAERSFEFGALMREIIPRFEIVPVQAFDSKLVRPRAQLTLDLGKLDSESKEGEIDIELDLFVPPKHFRFVSDVLETKRRFPKYSYPKIANAINEELANNRKEGEPNESISYMTVKRCFSTAKKMEAAGLSSPYSVLDFIPSKASRWKQRS